MPGPNQPRTPRASIIVLTYNQLEYTRKCVDSLYRHTPEPYELIFVDNASSDGTVDFLRTVPNSKLVVNSENLGFAGGNNQGLAIAEGEYVVLLNNDAIVTPGWLDHMLAAFDRDPSIGFVGPRSNYVAGAQLLPEVPYTKLEDLDAFAVQRASAYAGQGSPTLFIVGFCLALRRSVVERIGGLDTRFGSGNFEDNDYCLRAVRGGWAGWIADDVFVHHYGHRTFIGAGIDWTASMRKNGHLFADKWGLEYDGARLDFGRLPEVLRAKFDPARDYFSLPCDVTYTQVTPALAAYHEGVHRLNSGQTEEAVRWLQQAVAGAPQLADFHNALAAAYFETGQIELAVGEFARAVQLAPEDESIRANLEEAKASLRQAPRPIAVDPLTSLVTDDSVIYANGIADLDDPVSALRAQRELLKPGGQVLLRVPNAQGVSALRALLSGDRPDPRARLELPYSEMTKILLDAGFAPEIVHMQQTAEAHDLLDAAAPLIRALGLDQQRTRHYLSISEYIFRGTPLGWQETDPQVPITFVACVNNDDQLYSNLLRSPSLREPSKHQIILVRDAVSAADGLNYGIEHAENDVVVLLHQDVYLPAGWDARFIQQYELAQAHFGELGILGVFGTALEHGVKHEYGHVVDRHTLLLRGPVPARVDTLDELLLVVPRRTPLRFDSSLGWHLYGADFALQARERGLGVGVIDALCFHNSRGGYALPDAYWRSADAFTSKWREQLPVVTPCASFGFTRAAA